MPIPKSPDGSWNTSKELDYLMTADIFATAWEGVRHSGFQSGDVVVVFGAGPIGQMAAYISMLRGAARVYSVDRVEARLKLAESIGAIPINYQKTNAIEELQAREPNGVDRSFDAVGFEARNHDGTKYASNSVLDAAFEVTRPYGGVGVIGVYYSGEPNPGQPLINVTVPNQIPINYGSAFMKGLQFGRIGNIDVRYVGKNVLNIIAAGKASPGYVVSSVIDIHQAPEYYERFSNWEEVKVVIKF